MTCKTHMVHIRTWNMTHNTPTHTSRVRLSTSKGVISRRHNHNQFLAVAQVTRQVSLHHRQIAQVISTMASPAPALKQHWLLNKTECIKELESEGTLVNARESTVAELRVLVREQREKLGLIHKKTKNDDLMSQINKAKHAGLLEMCQAREIPLNTKPSVGEMRIALKQWMIQQGSGDTVMEIGKHLGMTFHEIAVQFPDYLEWANQEVDRSADPDWRLRQLVAWFRRMNATPESAKNKITQKKDNPVTTNTKTNKQTEADTKQLQEVMMNMAEKMKEMQEELAEVKGQRKKHAGSRDESMGSFEAVNQ